MPGTDDALARTPGGARPNAFLPGVALALCVALFAAVALDVEWSGLIARADPHVADWAFTRLHAWDGLLAAVTWLGDWRIVSVVALAAAGILARDGRRRDAVLLLAAGATAALATVVLKDAFGRARPPYVDPAAGPHSFSFPSGHTSGAFAVYVLAALFLTDRRPLSHRGAALTGALALASLVGLTRILLPVHYTTDVIAGAALGLGVVAAALVVRLPSVARG